MKNYIKPLKRRNTNCYKWDSVEDNKDLIPLWIADMDLKCPKEIVNAVVKRAKHAAYGYVKVPQKYYDALCNWFDKMHGWRFEPSDVVYTIGVVPAVSAVIKAVTNPNDKILMFTPVYNCFYSSIRNNDCTLLSCPLKKDENNVFNIDFEKFDKLCQTEKPKSLLLCNPHNPVSRVFTLEELIKIAEICLKNDVFIISDEIHCEIVMPGYQYIPFGIAAEKVGLENYAVCNSPSKTFNTASLQIANIVCKNSSLRRKINRAININECCDVNPFGVEALITGYTSKGCRIFIQDLIKTVSSNYALVVKLLKEIPEIKITPLQATYLMWIDCSALNKKSKEIEKELLEKYHVWINPGSLYGEEGEGYMRINLAAPPKVLAKGINRFIEYYKEVSLAKQ